MALKKPITRSVSGLTRLVADTESYPDALTMEVVRVLMARMKN